MFLLDALKNYAKTDRVALVNRSEQLTFAQLDAQSDAFAAFLLEELGEGKKPSSSMGRRRPPFWSV